MREPAYPVKSGILFPDNVEEPEQEMFEINFGSGEQTLSFVEAPGSQVPDFLRREKRVAA